MGDATVKASQWRLVERGRVVLFTSGKYEGRLAAIVSIHDHKRVCFPATSLTRLYSFRQENIITSMYSINVCVMLEQQLEWRLVIYVIISRYIACAFQAPSASIITTTFALFSTITIRPSLLRWTALLTTFHK